MDETTPTGHATRAARGTIRGRAGSRHGGTGIAPAVLNGL